MKTEGVLAGHHQICREANVLTKNAVKFASLSSDSSAFSPSSAAFASSLSAFFVLFFLLCLSRDERDYCPSLLCLSPCTLNCMRTGVDVVVLVGIDVALGRL